MNSNKQNEDTFFCLKCLKILQAGNGDFFEVRLLAVRDPATKLPDLSSESARNEYEAIVEQMASMSSNEAIDSVAQSRTLHLCDSCLDAWLENPCN